MNKVTAYAFILLVLGLLLSNSLLATTYTTVTAGKWNSNSTWDQNGSPGNYWGANDQVIILHQIDLNQNLGFAGSLNIENTGNLIGDNKAIALYNGATLVSNGVIEIKTLTLNSTSNATISAPLTLKNHLTIGSNSSLNSNASIEVGIHLNNNGGVAIFNHPITINGNLSNNNGRIEFLDDAQVGGQVQNNNSSAELKIEDNFTVNGNLQNNSGATIKIGSGSSSNIAGNFSNNSSSHLTVLGRLNSNSKFDNNGGTVDNQGIFDGQGQLTQNGGTYTNSGISLVHGGIRVNSNGTISGEGLIRANTITNYGTISGKNDVCAIDDKSMPSQNGGGSYSSTTTYCQMSASEALPIVLDYFKVEGSANSLHFFWKTLAEINNDYFDIEYSPNGKEFNSLLQIDGAGNSNTAIVYDKTIVNPSQKTGYFRLKQTDFDNKFSYSETVFYKNENELPEIVNIYPNPNDGRRLFIELNGVEAGHYVIALLNSKGALIKQTTINLDADALYYEAEILHGQTLAPDLYYVRISNNSERFLKKLIVR